MKIFALITGIMFLAAQVKAPNYIGMSKTEIIKVMQKTNPGFDYDDGAKNSLYKYLKFVDKYNEETWLFFLSETDQCTYTKLMSDFSNLKSRTDQLNKTCKKAGENKWYFIDKGITYNVELKKEEWYFTIITKKKK